MHLESHLPRLVQLAIDIQVKQSLAIGGDGVERHHLNVHCAENSQARQRHLSSVDAVDAELPSLAGTDTIGNDVILDVHRLILDEGAITGDDGIRVTHAIIIDHLGGNVMRQVTAVGIIGNVVCLNHFQVNHTLVLNAVG